MSADVRVSNSSGRVVQEFLPAQRAGVRQSSGAEIKHQIICALSPDNQTIRLHAGEMSAQEMRTVQAVLGWLRADVSRILDGRRP